MITIIDDEAPTLENIPNDLTVSCIEDVPPVSTDVLPSDNCSFDTEFEETHSGDFPCNYTITRTWTVTDACGLTVSKSQIITVKDEVPPTACEPEDKTVECEGTSANMSKANKWNEDNIHLLEDCGMDNCSGVSVTSTG